MQAEVLENIVSTIVAAQVPTASNDQRNAAAHALTQVRSITVVHLLQIRKLLPFPRLALACFVAHTCKQTLRRSLLAQA